jgi:hypothetical protein
MINRHARWLGLLVGPLLLLAGCQSGRQHTTRLLDDRLHDRLAPDIAAGNAVLQPLPDGARVTLVDTSLFPNDVKTLDNHQVDVRADVIEGLLDPTLMQIQIADTAAVTDRQRAERVRNVSEYFVDNGLASTLQPAGTVVVTGPVPAPPPGLAITISVRCPDRHGGIGYDGGTSKPVCD